MVSLADVAGNISAAVKQEFMIGNKTTQPDGWTEPPPPAAPTFLMGGRNTQGYPAELLLVSTTGGSARAEPINHLMPLRGDRLYIDVRGGKVAMWVDPAVSPPAGRGPVAIYALASPNDIKWVPTPAASKDFHYEFQPIGRPVILDDGRVVLTVTLETDTVGDDYHAYQLALWDPATDQIETQGALDSLALAQPEVQNCNCDPDAGTLRGMSFAVSPDGKYAYFAFGSYGVDAGMLHGGPSFIGRWDLATKQSESVVFTDPEATPWVVSKDGGKVLLNQETHFRVLDVAAKKIIHFDDYGEVVGAGQAAGNLFLKSWGYCQDQGGLIVYDLAAMTAVKVISAPLLPKYRDIGNTAQISPDGTMVYALGADGACGSGGAMGIWAVPNKEEATAEAILLGELPSEYSQSIFLLVQ